MNKAIAAAYIFFIVGQAVAKVGEMPKNVGPTEWWVPVMIFFIMALPWVMGYMAGKEDATVAADSRTKGE